MDMAEHLRLPLLEGRDSLASDSDSGWGPLSQPTAPSSSFASRLWCSALASPRMGRIVTSSVFYRAMAAWLLVALAIGLAASHEFVVGFTQTTLPPTHKQRLSDTWNHGEPVPVIFVIMAIFLH